MNNLINFDDYLIHKKVKLSSGLESNKYYNFRNLKIRESHRLQHDLMDLVVGYLIGISTIVDCGRLARITIVGVKEMGSYIGKIAGNCIEYDPHTNELEKELHVCQYMRQKYILFDDVFTTGKTMEKAINYIGYQPEMIVCIVNRSDVNNNKEWFYRRRIIEIKEIIEKYNYKQLGYWSDVKK